MCGDWVISRAVSTKCAVAVARVCARISLERCWFQKETTYFDADTSSVYVQQVRLLGQLDDADSMPIRHPVNGSPDASQGR